jgi:hypothetical protein
MLLWILISSTIFAYVQSRMVFPLPVNGFVGTGGQGFGAGTFDQLISFRRSVYIP